MGKYPNGIIHASTAGAFKGIDRRQVGHRATLRPNQWCQNQWKPMEFGHFSPCKNDQTLLVSPGHGFGCALKNSQMTVVPSKSRQTLPMTLVGKYCNPFGQVWPP